MSEQNGSFVLPPPSSEGERIKFKPVTPPTEQSSFDKVKDDGVPFALPPPSSEGERIKFKPVPAITAVGSQVDLSKPPKQLAKETKAALLKALG